MTRLLFLFVGSVLLLLGTVAPGGTFMMAAGLAILICASPWFAQCVRWLRRCFALLDRMMKTMQRVAGRRMGGILAATDPDVAASAHPGAHGAAIPPADKGAATTHFRACNLCEAICGLEIEHDTRSVISIKGDALDPLSQGHICPKALALKDIHEDPSRLRAPVKKTADGWREVAWEEAFAEIAERTRVIRDQHGDRALAVYLGNPTVHNYGAMLFQRPFVRALGKPQVFSATSVDQLPHHFAASFMFGHTMLIPVPDIDRTDFMLIMGANPIASNGSLMTAPGVRRRLKAIRKRGGRVVVVDPRHSETAALADEHHFIRPGSDFWLLAALLHVVLAEKLDAWGHLSGALRSYEQLTKLAGRVSPEVASGFTGIDAETIRGLARDFAGSATAVCYGRMGLSTQRHGGLSQWLVNVLNIVTGNFDTAGGAMLTSPAVPVVGRDSTLGHFDRWRSNVRELPEFDGQLPVAALAEEMLAAGDDNIRGLFTFAGNPVLSTPNGRQLDAALEGLDLHVAIDIYINESSRHADFILPTATGLETEHYDLAFHALAVRNTAKFSPSLFSPPPGLRYDWQVLGELARRVRAPRRGLAGVRERSIAALMNWLTPSGILNVGLKLGPHGAWRSPTKWFTGLSLRRLRQAPHGIDFGPLESKAPGCLRTRDKKINLVPTVLRVRFEEVLAEDLAGSAPHGNTFELIGRRDLRSNNSWMHNVPRLIKGKNRATLLMNREDAKRLCLQEDQIVRVQSRIGSIELPLQQSDDLMPGVVSIPHGFGHNRPGTRLPVAEANAGVSINDVTDERVVDPLTGTAAFSGQRVTVGPMMPSGDA